MRRRWLGACLGLLLFTRVSVSEGLDYTSAWQCDNEKFHWYCDEAAREALAQSESVKAAPMNAEAWRQELKRREDIAVMNPSDKNLTSYLAFWQQTQEKGAVFADRWRRVVWQHPELDYSLKRPTNNAGIKLHETASRDREEKQLKTLAREHGLIFFFRSDCPYCHTMATTLKGLADRYGFDVLGVTLDGGRLPEFPSPRDGRQQAAAWGVPHVPALFIGSKRTGEHAPIGFGMMSLTEIVQRMVVLTQSKPGEMF